MGKRTCTSPDCDRPHYAHGCCKSHYDQRRQAGDLPPRLSAEERFWAKVDKNGPGGCWLWTGRVSFWGYGMFWSGKTQVYAHRFAHELLVGPIPEGFQGDHVCRVKSCVRQDKKHVEFVTSQENNRRRLKGRMGAPRAERTHCPKGHPYDEANTIRRNGRRHCRACKEERLRLAREATARRGRKLKTHCVRGHAYTPENTAANGRNRACRQCLRENARRRYREMREVARS